ncbi:MAG: hypothetical protein V1784_05850 [bacterium]
MKRSWLFGILAAAAALSCWCVLVTADVVHQKRSTGEASSVVLSKAPTTENAEEHAKKQHIEELLQRIQQLKAADMYDAALWNEYLRLTEGEVERPTGHFDQGGETWETAVFISSLPYDDIGELGANDDCVGRPYQDVFYGYIAQTDGPHTFNMCGDYSAGDTYIRVWYEIMGICAGYTLAGDDNCAVGGMDGTVTVTLTSGQEVYVECGYYYTAGGTTYEFHAMSLPPEPGMNCAYPIDVTLPPDIWPYADTNTTCGMLNDYTETCLGYYDGGEDIIYRVTVTSAVTVMLSLTSDATWVGMCIDDMCPPDATCLGMCTSSGGSCTITDVSLNPGTYYIMIDTWPLPDCIPVFELTITEQCIVDCPPGGLPEGEPICHDNYDDQFNGGCGSDPIVFSEITCGDIICGTSGTFLYDGMEYRDTDWYQLVLTQSSTLTWSAVAEFPVLLVLIDAQSGDCYDYIILGYQEAPSCSTATIVAECLPAGLYWLWIAPSVFSGISCGADYVATASCQPCPGGTIQLSTDYIEFAPTYIGESSTVMMTVTNTHDSEELVVEAVTTTGHVWDVEPTSFELPLGGTQPVIITFLPTFEHNDYDGTIEFFSSDPTNPRDSLHVTGIGCKPVEVPPAPILSESACPTVIYFAMPWDANGITTQYAVEYSDNGFATSEFVHFDGISGPNPDWATASIWGQEGTGAIRGLEPNTDYQVRLRARDCTGAEAVGPAVDFSTLPDIVVDNLPELTIHALDANTVELRWDPVVKDTAGNPLPNLGYIVYMGAIPGIIDSIIGSSTSGMFQVDISGDQKGFFYVSPILQGVSDEPRPFISWPPNGAVISGVNTVVVQDFAHSFQWDSLRVEIDSAGVPVLIGSSFNNPWRYSGKRAAATDFNRFEPGEYVITATVVDEQDRSWISSIAVMIVPRPFSSYVAQYDPERSVFILDTTGVTGVTGNIAEIYWPTSTAGERYGSPIEFEWKPGNDSLTVVKPFIKLEDKVLTDDLEWLNYEDIWGGVVPEYLYEVVPVDSVDFCCLLLSIKTAGTADGTYGGNAGLTLGPLVDCMNGVYTVGYRFEVEVIWYPIRVPGSYYYGQDAKGDRTTTLGHCGGTPPAFTPLPAPAGNPNTQHKNYNGVNYPRAGAAYGNDDYRPDNHGNTLDANIPGRRVRWYDRPSNTGQLPVGQDVNGNLVGYAVRSQGNDQYFARADPECPPVPPVWCCKQWDLVWDVVFCENCTPIIQNTPPTIQNIVTPSPCPALAAN